jgi:hypothetical protein
MKKTDKEDGFGWEVATLREAPPTRKPSTSGCPPICLQLAAVTEPACKGDLQMLRPKINFVQVCKHCSWYEYPNWEKT